LKIPAKIISSSRREDHTPSRIAIACSGAISIPGTEVGVSPILLEEGLEGINAGSGRDYG